MDTDPWIERGLYDRSAPGADVRLGLLQYLAAEGVTLDEMVAADREGRLPFAAAEMIIRGGRERLTLAELAERAATPAETVRRMWLADGFPNPGDTRPFSEANVESVPQFAVAAELFGEEAALRVIRVMGWAMARVAEAEVTMFATQVGGPLVEAGATELELARTGVEVAHLLTPIARFLDLLHRHHLEAAIRRFGGALEGLGLRPVAAPVAVGFADLTGYTAFSGRLPTEELQAALIAFETIAREVVTATGSQLVKLIGDEIMFVTHDATQGCGTAAALHDAVNSHEVLPSLRCGLAFGDVLTCDGDYYGPVVNLAARTVAVAEPGDTLVDAAIRDAASNELSFTSMGQRQLKGFEETIDLYRLAR